MSVTLSTVGSIFYYTPSVYCASRDAQYNFETVRSIVRYRCKEYNQGAGFRLTLVSEYKFRLVAF